MLIRLNPCFASALLVLTGLANIWGQTPQQPDYSNINDILDGNRTLSQIDDLIVGNAVLKTSTNTQIKDSDIYTLPGIDANNRPEFEVTARMFNLPVDVLVYGNEQGITVLNPATKQTINISDPSLSNISFVAVGDLNRDGYSDIAITMAVSASALATIRIISAADPQDF